MTNEMENKCLSALKSTMSEYYYSPYQFCIGGYSEEAICLNVEDGEWCVSLYERGYKTVLSKHHNLLEACLDYISQNVPEKEERNLVKDSFTAKLFSPETPATSSAVHFAVN